MAFASELSLSSLRDNAESGLREAADGPELKEPKPPPDFLAAPLSPLPDGFEAERLLKEPKPPFDDEDDERCDENPLLKDEELEGLASAGTGAKDRARLSASATCAYFVKVFSMVRRAVES
ncbi:hypothetical protein [Massilia aerilata]|uniref:Uncharacterized protein n=1 Tax=Massilia aerilata TaxID=453817 RepID=A0ABW0RXG2_9BURK